MFSITIVPLSPHRVQPRSLPRGLPLTVFFWGILVRGKNVLCGLMHGWMILRWTLTERRLERGLQNSSVEMKYLDIFHRKDWGSVCLDDYVWIGGDLLWRRRWIGEKRRWSDGSSTFIEVRKFFVDNDQQKVFKNFYDQRQKARNDFSAKLHAILVHFLLHPNLLISLRSILLHIDLIPRICNPRITLGGRSSRSGFLYPMNDWISMCAAPGFMPCISKTDIISRDSRHWTARDRQIENFGVKFPLFFVSNTATVSDIMISNNI